MWHIAGPPDAQVAQLREESWRDALKSPVAEIATGVSGRRTVTVPTSVVTE